MASPPSSPSAKRYIKFGLRLSLAIAAMALLFTQVPFTDVWYQATQAHTHWLLAAIAMGLATQLAVAWRLSALTRWQGLPFTTYKLFELNLATLFYGLFLPGQNFTGIAIRFYRLSADQKHYAAVGVALLVDRLLATVSLAIVGVAFFFIDTQIPNKLNPVIWILFLGALTSIALTLTVIRPNLFPGSSTLNKLMDRLPIKKVQAARQAINDNRKIAWSATLRIFFYSIFAHIIGILCFHSIAYALDLPVSFATIGWMRSAIIFATMIPISFSGLGLREGAAWAMLAAYAVSADQSIAFALLIFACSRLTVGLIGGIYEIKRTFFLTSQSSS